MIDITEQLNSILSQLFYFTEHIIIHILMI